jgi:hypothetical protein
MSQSKPLIAKETGKKSVLVLFAIMLLVAGLYPKTASLTVPGRWSMLPLRQTKDIVHNYLGEPITQNNATGYDEWAGGSKGKMYFLKIYYVSDTIAAGYSIHYRYKNFLVSKDYLIDSFSIR